MASCTTVRVITELGLALARPACSGAAGVRAPSAGAVGDAAPPCVPSGGGRAGAGPTPLVGILRRLRAR